MNKSYSSENQLDIGIYLRFEVINIELDVKRIAVNKQTNKIYI